MHNINNMKNTGSVRSVPYPSPSQLTAQNTERNNRSVIEIANILVDGVTQSLCSEIMGGDLQVDDEEKQLNVFKSQIAKVDSKTIDLDQHKKKVKQFIKMNRKFRKNRQMRSVEMSERSIKQKEEYERNISQSKSKALEERRKMIQMRMQAKKQLIKEIHRSTLQSNTKYKQVSKKKFLYQQKQEEFYKKVTLPKIEQEKQIIEKKRSLRKPIDMSELYNHEKKYEQSRINQRLNRSITISMINHKDNSYQPPQFIPQSFKKVRHEEELKKQEQMFKKKQHEINQIRKREYSRRIDQIRAQERQLSKSFSKSPKNKQTKEKVKPKFEREEVKNIGNQYLKELLKSNRKFTSTTKKINKTESEEIQKKRKIRSQYEIQIVKEQRIERIQTIRHKKINSIVKNKKLDDYSKFQILKSEIEKYDEVASLKLKNEDDVENINEGASIMMNSIHAKLALLGCPSL